jgi:hypothetical protein
VEDVARPPILTAGILLTGARSALCLGLIALVAVLGTIGTGFGALAAHGDDWVPLLVIAGLAAAGGTLLGLLQLFVLAVCVGAWFGVRECLWILIGLSALGFLSPGPIKTPIGVLTLAGCIQAIERNRTAPATHYER